jgi:hypothetical protein
MESPIVLLGIVTTNVRVSRLFHEIYLIQLDAENELEGRIGPLPAQVIPKAEGRGTVVISQVISGQFITV